MPKQSAFLQPEQARIVTEKHVEQEDVIIGQYKRTYILIEREEGLEIVDQHIAEERYIYEKLKKSKKRKTKRLTQYKNHSFNHISLSLSRKFLLSGFSI